MTTAMLEHANYTVSDPLGTAAWMTKLFGWHIRWKGDAIDGGTTVHVGTENHYLALYTPDSTPTSHLKTYETIAGLNHIAIVVDDLEAMENAVREQGFTPGKHHDYEPGRRFYFHDHDGIEYEVVQYN
jgi:catechol 2,3-dioxygenase-like lactoylglutathione lyase family enzyme